jgi:transposase InsO family protein
VNRKRIRRILREDNLLCLRKRKFVTSDSRHARTVYSNLAQAIAPTSINQLWVADITYVRLHLGNQPKPAIHNQLKTGQR